jgi:hypothetical protein
MAQLGPFIRHLVAIVVGFVVMFTAQFLGVEVTDSQRAALDGGLTVLGGFIVFVAYAWLEKLLKRVPWIDPAGYADYLRTTAEGERLGNIKKEG